MVKTPPKSNDKQEITAQHYYSDKGFWKKIKRFAVNIGKEALEKLLILYYCFNDPATPKKEKTIILGALGYFVMPFDVIPDLLPGGWTDDLGVLALAFAKVAKSINDTHTQKAREKLNKLTRTA